MSDLIIEMASAPPPPPPPPPGPATGLEQMTFSNPPTLAQMERLLTERWHTRPAWLYDGTFASRKIVGVDPLPAGMTFYATDQPSPNADIKANSLVVDSGQTVADFSGWDLLETQTTIYIRGNGRILKMENVRFAPKYTTKANRVSGATGEPCLRFQLNQSGRIDYMNRCQFTQHPLHEGVRSPGAYILAQSNNNTGYAQIDLMEFCSFEGYNYDAMKGAWSGIRRYCFLDAPWNIPNDARPWSPPAEYNRGDVVWGGSNLRLRMCVNNGVTNAPDFNGAETNTPPNWVYLDPHSDTDQPSATPQNKDVVWFASIFIRDQGHRRFPSRQQNRGVVNAMRYIANSDSQDIGPVYVRYCLFSEEVELFASNKYAIEFASAARSYGGTPKVAEFNWYQDKLQLNTGAHITVRNNIPNWDFPAPATLSGVSVSYSGGALSYGFTPSKGGWMRVVVNGSATPLTARQIVEARDGDSGVRTIFEIDAQGTVATTGAATVSLPPGTYYAHGLYQHGGGSDTLAPVLTIVVS